MKFNGVEKLCDVTARPSIIAGLRNATSSIYSDGSHDTIVVSLPTLRCVAAGYQSGIPGAFPRAEIAFAQELAAAMIAQDVFWACIHI